MKPKESLSEKISRISKKNHLSPLRYPGGKRKLAPLVADIFQRQGTDIKLFVEPFVGGAALSLCLLESGVAEEIAIADKDDLVAAFWQVVFSNEAEKLADQVSNSKVNIRSWRKIKADKPSRILDKAFKCIFLNRTSFSGILHDRAGPIGGIGQTGKYRIDCRFNKDALSRRIIELSNYKDRVRFIRCQSYKKTFSDIKQTKLAKNSNKNLYWYLDPPFIEKANFLYRSSFKPADHELLKKQILDANFPGNWVLSYDDVQIARDLYSKYKGFSRVNLSYNARVDSVERLIASEIVVSNVIERLRLKGRKGIPAMGKIIPLNGFTCNRNASLGKRVAS